MIRKILLLIVMSGFGYSIHAQSVRAAFHADTTLVCVNVPLQFNDNSTAGQIASWSWNFSNGDVSNDQNPVITFSTAGLYTVSLTITDTGGVINTKTRTNYIRVRDLPTADFLFDRLEDHFISDTIALSSYWYNFYDNSIFPDTLPCSYYWNFGDGTYIDTVDTLVHQFKSARSFNVEFIVETGLNCQDTASSVVKVEDVFNAANIFTPNGDGINDLFVIETNGYNTYKMIIFNRWGNIVKTVEAKKLIWDGYSSAGVKLEPGIYFYHVVSDEIPNFKKSGFIYLY